MLTTKKGLLAVKPPEFKKIEAEIIGGIARVSQRVNLQEVELVMDGYVGEVYLRAGCKIILRGEAGTLPWAKQIMNLGQLSFALCPESDVIGYRTDA